MNMCRETLLTIVKTNNVKNILLLISFLVFTSGFGQANPFTKLKFDKVIAYDFSGGKESDLSIVTPAGKLSKSVSKQKELPNSLAKELSIQLGSKSSYGKGTASCFEPHLGFVYYYKGKIVAHVTVCLDCNRLRSSIDIPAQKQGKAESEGEVYYMLDGMSDAFRSFLNAIVKQYQFSHAIK